MRTILLLSLGLSALLPAMAKAQDFSLIFTSEARAIQSQANTPLGQATLASANNLLRRDPNPVTVIRMEGKLPNDPDYKITSQAAADLPGMTDLALAYRLTGDRKYLDAATRYIKAWASTYQTRIDPIDDQDFYYFFIANDLVSSDLPSDVKALTKTFCEQYAQAYMAEIERAPSPGDPAADPNNPVYKGYNKPDPTRINNFQSHRLKLAVLAAFAAGDDSLIKRAHTAYEKQVAININPDGSVLDFHTRDALHYVIYDLEPLLIVAMAAHAHTQDWFSYRAPNGSSLEAAVSWLVPFAEGQQTHQEFIHSNVPFDQQRAKAGVKGFSGPWDPKGSVTTFAYASVLNPKFRKVLTDVESQTGGQPPHFMLAVEP